MLSTIGNSNQDVVPNQIIELDYAMSAKICMIWATYCGNKDDKHDSTTELENQDNTAVVGVQATVFHTSRNAKVSAFSDEM